MLAAVPSAEVPTSSGAFQRIAGFVRQWPALEVKVLSGPSWPPSPRAGLPRQSLIADPLARLVYVERVILRQIFYRFDWPGRTDRIFVRHRIPRRAAAPTKPKHQNNQAQGRGEDARDHHRSAADSRHAGPDTPDRQNRFAAIRILCAGLSGSAIEGRIHGITQSILRIGANDSHDSLRSLADAQLRFVEQPIDDVPIAFDPVIDELRIAVASEHK